VIGSSWNNGFVANVTITNRGSSAWNGWNLGWAFDHNQTITNLWNGILTQSGQNVLIRNLAYNGQVAPGASVAIGFQASFNGNNPIERNFTVNGVACQ
jgi:cellulase/cellobiase CelA1